MMNDSIKKLVEKYQCPGCVCGSDISCYENKYSGQECSKHVSGTMVSGIGKLFLGMPKGFNRKGTEVTTIYIYEQFKSYDKFNIPVWKHFDGENTIVRGLSPRIDIPFIDILKGDHISTIDCLEITKADMETMD